MDAHWAYKNLFQFENFNDFVLNWLCEENADSWMHLIPQYKFIYDDEAERLQIDYLLRFENLSQDFEYVSRKLNLRQNLPHINASKRTRYQDYYTEETKNIVSRVYAKDIELFGYSFEE